MTRGAAIRQWFNALIPGVPAYPETAVPSKAYGDDEDVAFPFLTYSGGNTVFGEETSYTVNLYFYTEDEAVINAAETAIYNKMKDGGALIHSDEGTFWMKPGSPFSQPVDEQDNRLKRRYINITQERISA